MQIWAAEILTTNLPEEVRDRLFSLADRPASVFGNRRRGFDEIFLLVTDSQFVVYGVGESVDPMLNLFLQDPAIHDHVHFYKSTEACVNHLFATATGLCANLKGVRTANRKIRQAHYDALHCGGMGLVLDNLVRQSMRVSKKVRAETGIENLGQILVDAGMDIVFNHMDSPFELAYLIIGTGDIARCALEFFRHEGFRNVVIAGDDHASSQRLAEKFSVNCIEADEIETFIQLSDVVICEDSVVHAFSSPVIKYGNDARKIFLDFGNAFPGEELRRHPACRHYTIDDINNSPSANAQVFHSLEAAWKLVETEAKLAIAAVNDLRQVPFLQSCWSNIVKRGEQGICLLREFETPDQKDLSRIRFFNNVLLKKRQEFSRLVQYDTQPSSHHSWTAQPGDAKKLTEACWKHMN